MPEIRLYGKNPKESPAPGQARVYWTDIEAWRNERKKLTGRAPKTFNVTTRSNSWARNLSPIIIGPVATYRENGRMLSAINAEVAWQYSKIFSHAYIDEKLQDLAFLNGDGTPNASWFAWRNRAWTNPQFHHRHRSFAANKALVRRAFPKGSRIAAWYWDGRIITDPVQARREIYASVYCNAVRELPEFKRLRELAAEYDLNKIPFFLKQVGTSHKSPDRILDGRTWDEFPAGFQK